MSKTDTAKSVVKFIVGASTAFTVKRLLRQNIETDKKRHDAEVYIGSAAIGFMAAEAAENHIDRTFDQLSEIKRKAFDKTD